MSSSQARILANQANAKHSTGPKTLEGKEISRQNSYKHGLTGNGVVMSVEDAAEVERRSAAFHDELQPSGEVGQALARRAAFMSVQLDRSMARDNDATAERVRQVEADFVAPEGVDAAEAERLKDVAKRQATFDPSPEAALDRKYQDASERGLLRCLKELRPARRPASRCPDGHLQQRRSRNRWSRCFRWRRRSMRGRPGTSNRPRHPPRRLEIGSNRDM